MASGFAKYEIEMNNRRIVLRYFINPVDALDLTDEEEKARDVVREGFSKRVEVLSGEADPFKAAEEILANHYGYAKMVEAHYAWRPGIIY